VLLAAWIDPVTTSAVRGVADALFAAALYALLVGMHWPPWAVVVGAIGIGALRGLAVEPERRPVPCRIGRASSEPDARRQLPQPLDRRIAPRPPQCHGIAGHARQHVQMQMRHCLPPATRSPAGS